MRHATKHLTEPSDTAHRAVMDDVVAVLFADENAYEAFSAWIDAELARLEERFASFATADSIARASKRRRTS